MFLQLICTREFFERRINGHNGIDVEVGNLSTFVLCDYTESFTVQDLLALRSFLPAASKESNGDTRYKVVRVTAPKPSQAEPSVTVKKETTSSLDSNKSFINDTNIFSTTASKTTHAATKSTSFASLNPALNRMAPTIATRFQEQRSSRLRVITPDQNNSPGSGHSHQVSLTSDNFYVGSSTLPGTRSKISIQNNHQQAPARSCMIVPTKQDLQLKTPPSSFLKASPLLSDQKNKQEWTIRNQAKSSTFTQNYFVNENSSLTKQNMSGAFRTFNDTGQSSKTEEFGEHVPDNDMQLNSDDLEMMLGGSLAKKRPEISEADLKFGTQTVVSDNVRCDLRQSILRRRSIEGKQQIDLFKEESERQEQIKKYRMTRDELRKIEIRKEHNRRSASKCRFKRKMMIETLSKALKSEHKRNALLKKHILDMLKLKKLLNDQLIYHDTHCKKRMPVSVCICESIIEKETVQLLPRNPQTVVVGPRGDRTDRITPVSLASIDMSIFSTASGPSSWGSSTSSESDTQQTLETGWQESHESLDGRAKAEHEMDVDQGREIVEIIDTEDEEDELTSDKYAFTTYSEYQIGSVKEREVVREMESSSYDHTETPDVVVIKDYEYNSVSSDILHGVEKTGIIESLEDIKVIQERNIAFYNAAETMPRHSFGKSKDPQNDHEINTNSGNDTAMEVTGNKEPGVVENIDISGMKTAAHNIEQKEMECREKSVHKIVQKINYTDREDKVLAVNSDSSASTESVSSQTALSEIIEQLTPKEGSVKKMTATYEKVTDRFNREDGSCPDRSCHSTIQINDSVRADLAATKGKSDMSVTFEQVTCDSTESDFEDDDETDVTIISIHSPGRLVVDVDA